MFKSETTPWAMAAIIAALVLAASASYAAEPEQASSQLDQQQVAVAR
jgi:hypothetical protein